MSCRVVFTLLICAASLTARQTSYVHRDDGWVRFDGVHSYHVHPSIITVLTSGAPDVQHILDGLEGDLAGARLIRSNRLGFHDLEVPEGRDVMEFVNALRAEGCFALVEENTIGRYVGGTPNDPLFGDQWNLENTGQLGGVPGADVNALNAWLIQDGDPSIVVAVADSGTDWTHEDLAGNMWGNTDEVVNGLDSDGNGYVDDIRGWDFDGMDNDPNGAFWHGTSVASVVASQGNNVGLIGLAGGAHDGAGVSVMALNVGSFFPIGDVLDDAILYALDNGAHIITMSLSVGTSSAIDAAVAAAFAGGVFIDCAAGNGGFGVSYPALLPEVVAVASTIRNDATSPFSNAGPEVEVAAPGEDVWMADLGGGYHTNSGTSFSSPHVAALAGLLLSEDPTLTNQQVRQIIVSSADDVDAPGNDFNTGSGRINAHEALLSISLTPGSATPYGVGTPGGGGLIPTIASAPLPVIGQTLEVRTTLGERFSPAALGMSPASASFPFLGGIINVHPLGLMTTGTSTSGFGSAALFFPIPANPSIIGGERFLQWFILDPDAPAGVSMSQGLHVIVGG